MEQLFGESWRHTKTNATRSNSLKMDNIKSQRKSRITYDRNLGVRYYKGTDSSDRNACDCEDI